MLISISQPAYLPWLGYLERIALSDLHIVLDHVQLEKHSFTVRNKIRTARGWQWLTVPLKTKGRAHDLPINTVEIQNESSWQKDHYQSILGAYKKTPYFAEHQVYLESYYANNWTKLSELCKDFLFYLLKTFDIKTKILFSSQMNSSLTKSDLILDLCSKVDCDQYLSGPFGRDYLDESAFQKAGIKIFYHDYKHPIYNQRYEPFEPYMSVIDLLFNCGEESKRIIRTSTNKEGLEISG